MSSYDNKRIGHRQDKRGNVHAYNRFVADLAERLDENVQELLADEVSEIQDEVEEIANNELLDYYKVVSSGMYSATKPNLRAPAGTFFKYNVFDRVVWFPLSKRTRELKRKWEGEWAQNVKWYSFDKRHENSTLKAYLNGLQFNGSATVTVQKFTGNKDMLFGKDKRAGADFYQLTLNIPLDEDLIIEQMDDESQVVKAFGHPRGNPSNEERRPIFNPVAEYFSRQRIPNKIKTEMRRRGRNVEFT